MSCQPLASAVCHLYSILLIRGEEFKLRRGLKLCYNICIIFLINIIIEYLTELIDWIIQNIMNKSCLINILIKNKIHLFCDTV